MFNQAGIKQKQLLQIPTNKKNHSLYHILRGTAAASVKGAADPEMFPLPSF